MGVRIGIAVLAALVTAACGPSPSRKAAAPPTPEAEPEPAITVPQSTPVAVAPTTPGKTETATPTPTPKPVAKATPKPASMKPVAVSKAPPPADLWTKVSGERALDFAKKLTEFGPRPTGDEVLTQARNVITAALTETAWEVAPQAFSGKSEQGEITGTNLVARFSADGSRPVVRTPRNVVIGAHYDTRRFSTMKFVGANDGASGPAVLIEVARALALDPALAAKVELVFFDASEPRGQFSPEEGIFGSRAYAQQSKPRHALILQSVGDASTPFVVPPETAKDLLADLRAVVPAVNSPLRFKFARVRLWGDHLPFGANGLLLCNADAVFRYTADDTIERLDATTLGQTAQLAVWLAKHWAGQ